MNDKKPLMGASLIAGAVILVVGVTGYVNFKEIKQAEYMQVRTQAEVQSLKGTETPTVTPSMSASHSATVTVTPTKGLFFRATSSATASPVLKK
jgi:hypothetical protein